ncbi:MAG: hypothetical protein ACOYMN_12380 [Roseimicrobium sp.]
MFENIEPHKNELSKLASILNQFKSEAVQVRLLEQFLQGSPKAGAAGSPEVKRRGRPPKTESAIGAVAPVKTARRKRSKMGATTALHQLIESGFFKAHRTIAEVVDACKEKLSLEIAVTNLSGPLMRFVEEKKLIRAKNKDDKYEYWAK